MMVMRKQILSLAERLTPRLSSAGLTFLLAVVTTPSQVGVYAWAAIIYTAYLSVSDAAIRHVAVQAVRSVSGRRLLRKYSIVSSVVGPVLILLCLLILTRSSGIEARQIWLLTPFCLAPVLTAGSIRSVGELQLTGHWRVLVNGQFLAALFSLGIAAPLLLLTHSIVAAAAQVPLTEAAFTVWCRVASKRLGAGREQQDSAAGGYATVYRAMAVFGGVWAGARDRLTV